MIKLLESFVRLVCEVESEAEEIERRAEEPEYQSVEAFAEYALANEQETFDHLDLRALNMAMHRPVHEIRKELEGYGLTLSKRPFQKKIRGYTSKDLNLHAQMIHHGGYGLEADTGRPTVMNKTI